MTAGEPPLDGLDAALAFAAPALNADQCRLALAIYRGLATGRAVPVEQATRTAGVSAASAEATVHRWPAVYRDADAIVGFWGLALPESPHRSRVGQAVVHAWCAWDPFFIAPHRRRAGGRDRRPGHGRNHRLPARAQRPDRRSDAPPKRAVLPRARPALGRRRNGSVLPLRQALTNERTARDWTAEHAGTFAISLSDARALARRHVARSFGDGFALPHASNAV